jgi:hypothetical protein
MPDYYAGLIPHLEGLHRVLALRKQHLGLYDDLFVGEAGKFLKRYDMAASKEIYRDSLRSRICLTGRANGIRLGT